MILESKKVNLFQLVTLTTPLILPLLLVLSPVKGHAAGETKIGTVVDKKGQLGGDVSNKIGVGVNAERPNAYSKLTGTGRFYFSNSASFFVTLPVIKEFTGKKEFLLDDLEIGVEEDDLHTFVFPALDLKLRGGLSATLPTSKESRKLSQITALSGKIGAGTNIKRFILGYDLELTKYFHSFTTSVSGKLNKRHAIGNTLTAGVKLSDALDFMTNWHLTFFSTYDQKVPKGTYAFTQSLGYKITPKFTARAGAVTKGNQLKHGGTKSNISLFSTEGTELFMKLGYEFN